MRKGRARSWAAGFLLVFCAGTLLSPHRHLNPIADLVTDGQSDSGIVLVPSGPNARGGAPVVSAVRTITDEPCLACFWHDMTATVAPVFSLSVVSVMLAAAIPPAPVRAPVVLLTPPPSRGPPA